MAFLESDLLQAQQESLHLDTRQQTLCPFLAFLNRIRVPLADHHHETSFKALPKLLSTDLGLSLKAISKARNKHVQL